MTFTKKTWKEKTYENIRQIGRWLKRRKDKDLPYVVYGALSTMAIWPLVEAAQSGQLLPAAMALGSVAGGVGGNLLAEQIQRWADRADDLTQAETEMAIERWVQEEAVTNPAALEALDAILENMKAIPQAQAALTETERGYFDRRLQQELTRLGSSIQFEAILSGSGAIAQGDNAKAAAATGDDSVAIGQAESAAITQNARQSAGDHSAVGSAAGRDLITGDDNIAISEARDVTIIQQAETKTPALDEDTALTRYLDHIISANRRLQLQGIRSSGELVSIDLEAIYITLSATQQRSTIEEEAWLDEMQHQAPGEARRSVQPRLTQQTRVKVQTALADHQRLVVLGDPGSGKTTLLRYLALTYARELRGETGLIKKRLGLDAPEEQARLPILLPLREFARYLENTYPDSSADGPAYLLDYLRVYFANQDIALPERFFAERLGAGNCVVLLDGMDEVAAKSVRIRVSRIIERFTIAYPDNRYVVTSRIVGYKGSVRLAEEYAVTTAQDFNQADIERFVTYWNLAVEITLAREDNNAARLEAKKKSKALLAAIEKHERIRELAVNPLLLTVIALVQRYRAILPERRTELYEEAIEVLLSNWDEAKGMDAKTVLADVELDAGDRRGFLEPVALWMMENELREIESDALRKQLGQSFTLLAQDKRQVRKLIDAFLNLINERSGLLTERGQGIYSFSHLTFQEHLAARAIADRDDYLEFILARLDDSWWREVILLEAGYLGTQGKRRATALIRAIMDYQQEPEPYHNLVLAAECVYDVGPARLEGNLAREIQARVRREFEQPLSKRSGGLSAAVNRRAAAAAALARIESGRSGLEPAFWQLPYGEPVWADIPAGKFWMGEGENLHQVELDAFQIARVPITNAQYAFFVEATNHQPPIHWDAKRPPKGKESHPVVHVTWYDAIAYCQWLSKASGKNITLPSEAEWEKAARGDEDERIYPWSDTFEAAYCNSSELGIGDTTPVGIFPEGRSPYGCEDMAGNVWEWTRSLWDFKYPYDPEDGRENLEAVRNSRRVLRGGSCYVNKSGVRCALRFRYYPNLRYDYYGFRVVAAPPK